MNGDFSGLRRWPTKRYSSVRMQQGRVQLDVDWNDEVEILDYLSRTETVDVIGPSGAPKQGGGFALSVLASDLGISAGRFYVDGILCEAVAGQTYATQADFPGAPSVNAGKLSLADGTWLGYLDVWERAITALDDGDLREPALGGADTTIRARVVWQLKLLKVAVPAGGATCASSYPEWDALIAASTGRLAAHVGADTAGSRCTVESQLGFNGLENQLYRVQIHRGSAGGTPTFKWSRENGSVAALVTSVSGASVTLDALPPLGIAKGDWVELCDDGSELRGEPGVLVRVSNLTNTVLTLDETTVDLPPGVATLAAFLAPARVSGNLKVRRWEVSDPLATSAETAIPGTAGTWVPLENRVEVTFDSGKTYRTGDYWVVPARVAGGVVIWPLDPVAKTPLLQPPLGIAHHYARVGVLSQTAGVITLVEDCRPPFPPLTDIHATDVKFDDSICNFPHAKTVQDALDDLCRQKQNECCGVAITPDDDANALIQQELTKNGKWAVKGLHVCFTAGVFQLKAPLVFTGIDYVTVGGAGCATRILAPPQSEIALSFQGCKEAAVSDLYAESTFAGAGVGKRHRPESSAPADANRHLNGVLQFQNCGSASVIDASVKCGAASKRSAACITVRNDAAAAAADPGTGLVPVQSATVRGCDLQVGYEQVGVLLVNVDRSQVEDNRLTTYARPTTLGLDDLVQDTDYRAALRKLLLSNITLDGVAPVQGAAHPNTHLFSAVIGAHTLRFDTYNSTTAQAWSAVLASAIGVRETNSIAKLPKAAAPAANPTPTPRPPGTAKKKEPSIMPATLLAVAEARLRLKHVANDILLQLHGTPSSTPLVPAALVKPFAAWFKLVSASMPSMASWGIAVTGSRAREVRVLNNSVAGVLSGIRVALSHQDAQHRDPLDTAGRVIISGNDVRVSLPVNAPGERNGIFVGNANSIAISDNSISVTRFSNPRRVEGIRVYGAFGPTLFIERNQISGANVGIRAFAVVAPAKVNPPVWVIDNNAALDAPTPIEKNF